MYQYYGTEYLGAAHGLAGILQTLLSVPGQTAGLQDCSNDLRPLQVTSSTIPLPSQTSAALWTSSSSSSLRRETFPVQWMSYVSYTSHY